MMSSYMSAAFPKCFALEVYGPFTVWTLITGPDRSFMSYDKIILRTFYSRTIRRIYLRQFLVFP